MPVLDVQALIDDRVHAIRTLHHAVGQPRAELDLSGGVDSAVMLGLLARALGTDRVTTVHLAIHSDPAALSRARECAAAFGVPLVEFDGTGLFEALRAEMTAAMVKAGYDAAAIEARCAADPTLLGSIRSTLRAPWGRAANRLSGGGIRHGTGNEDEDRILRFYQKGGDGEVDTNPIAMLSKGEVYQLGRALGVPRSILSARPSPDLWGVGDRHNDEEEIAAYLGLSGCGLPSYSYLDLDTGDYSTVGLIERLSRWCDGTSGPRTLGAALFDDQATPAAHPAGQRPASRGRHPPQVEPQLPVAGATRGAPHRRDPHQHPPRLSGATMSTHLFLIDPQNDFCVTDDGHGNHGRLVVPGAEADMTRVAALIRRLGPALDEIHVTLDSHQTVGIERPGWWQRVSDGAPPAPFTCLGVHPDGERVVRYEPGADGLRPTEETYTTTTPTHLRQGGPTGGGSLCYLRALAARGRYPHVVWPEHCVLGTWGWSIVPELAAALGDWERSTLRRVNYVLKGNSPWTEHFSGLQAEVPDPADSATQLDTRLVAALGRADTVLVAGEALSHCVANSVRDLAEVWGAPEHTARIVLLRDACSNVAGFEALGERFLAALGARGMRLATSSEWGAHG